MNIQTINTEHQGKSIAEKMIEGPFRAIFDSSDRKLLDALENNRKRLESGEVTLAELLEG